jgi:hypothetical protein
MPRTKTTERRAADDRAPRVPPPAVTADAVARRAYDLYLSRGGVHGQDLDDWLQAEHEMGVSPGSAPA